MRLLKFTTLLICLMLGIFVSNYVNAQGDTASTIALSNKLNEINMHDLSFYLIEKEIREKPGDKDKLLVQKAQIYFSKGKTVEGEKIINAIASASPAYAFSRLVLGIEAVRKGKNEMAVKPLNEYFAYMKTHLPDMNKKAEVDEFLKAVGYLRHAYTKLGKPDDAVKVTGYTKWLEKAHEGGSKSDQQDQYEAILLAAQAKLDAAEFMIAGGKKGWEKIVNSVLKPLESIYWSGATAWTAMAAVERARALCMLKRYDDGMKELKKYLALIKNLDVGYKEQKMLYIAPSAKAYLWRGNLMLGQAGKATEDAKKIKLYFGAGASFFRVLKKYDTKKCPYTQQAVSGFNKSKEALAKLGKAFNVPAGFKMPGGSFERKSADEMFARNKYKDCIPLYLKLIHSPGGRTSKDTPDFLYRVSISYLKSGGALEAMALAGYLGDYFPTDKQFTPNTLLLVGEHFWKQYTNAKTKPAAKKEALDNALIVYGKYLKNCPTHEYAAPISARVAKVYYDAASELAKKASKMPNGQEKLKKTNEARESFKNAIPIYQHIVDNYAPTEMGKSSAYLLAWCYTNSREFVKGAELFLKFADLETNWEKPKQRNMGQVADAKLRAAENYVQEAVRLERKAKALRTKAEHAPKASTVNTEKPKDVAKDKPKAKEVKAEDKKENKDAVPAKNEVETEEALLAQAAANDKEAKVYFKKAVDNILELIDKWMKSGGRLAGVKKAKAKKKIAAVKEKAIALLGWAYDGAREQDKAIKAFTDYIKQYPEANGIPKSMLRLGMLYLEQDKANEAAQVLNTLSAKYPEEGKKALPKLARAMYDIKKYDKSIDAVTKIFAAGKVDLTVSDLKWIARSLVDCGGTHPKAGALLAQKACKVLEEMIKKPVLAHWLGKPRAKQLAANPKALKKTLGILKEQLLFLSASASFWSEDYQAAVDSLTTLLENKNTPYFWDGYFLRAASYMGLKKPEKALDDYGQISMALLGAKDSKDSLYFKVQCNIGDAYIALKNYGKAAGAYNNAAMSVMDTGGDDAEMLEKKVTPAEKKEQMKWVEYSVYMAACCQKKLARDKEVQILTDLYKEIFPQGKYKDKINNLPAPEAANKE
jgi:TolA-binding protein